MKFNDAFDKAWDQTPAEMRPKGVDLAKAMAMMWSIMAIAMKSKEKRLDDFAFINDNNIVSIPLYESEASKETTGNEENELPDDDENSSDETVDETVTEETTKENVTAPKAKAKSKAKAKVVQEEKPVEDEKIDATEQSEEGS